MSANDLSIYMVDKRLTQKRIKVYNKLTIKEIWFTNG